jgi:small GTP-binding protein
MPARKSTGPSRTVLIPKVVIVGRPNVGKSTLFNWLVEKRIAIEDPTAGVTRDRLVQRLMLEDRVVDLVDTGGMGFDDPDGLTAKIDAQIESGLGDAAVVLLVVDVRTGLGRVRRCSWWPTRPTTRSSIPRPTTSTPSASARPWP